MDDRNDNKRNLFCIGTPRCGLLAGLLGATLALLLIFLGFWNTLFVAIFAAAGYFLGAYNDKAARLKSLINKIFPPKSE